MKNVILGALAAVSGVLASFLGEWDAVLAALMTVMAADYLTGVIVAGVFKRSGKSESGALESRAGFKGLCRKGAILLVMLVAVRLDELLWDTAYCRTAVAVFFIGNEGLSILENLGVMGVHYPEFLKNMLDVLRDKGDKGKQ